MEKGLLYNFIGFKWRESNSSDQTKDTRPLLSKAEYGEPVKRKLCLCSQYDALL